MCVHGIACVLEGRVRGGSVHVCVWGGVGVRGGRGEGKGGE